MKRTRRKQLVRLTNDSSSNPEEETENVLLLFAAL